jgi:hypothetical protein
MDAARAIGTSAVEVRIFDRAPRVAKINADVGGRERFGVTILGGDLLKDAIGCREHRCRRRAEHSPHGRVMRTELGFPVGQPRPRRRAEKFASWRGQSVRVDERAAANSDARENGDVPEKIHAKRAAQTEQGRPQPAFQIPIGAREVALFELPALFEQEDAVPLLDEAQRADAPAEAGADDDVIVGRTGFVGARRDGCRW